MVSGDWWKVWDADWAKFESLNVGLWIKWLSTAWGGSFGGGLDWGFWGIKVFGVGMSFGCVFHLICEGCNLGCGSWILLRFRWFFRRGRKLCNECLFESFGLENWENFGFEGELVKTRVFEEFGWVWMNFETMLGVKLWFFNCIWLKGCEGVNWFKNHEIWTNIGTWNINQNVI